MPRIAIYLGAGSRIPSLYLLSQLCARWRAAGIEVVTTDRPEVRAEADAALLHIDATCRSGCYEQVLRNHARVINGRVRDISKRRISGHIVSRSTGYAGPVIVKTNGNNFGAGDFFDRRTRGRRARRTAARLLDPVLVVAGRIRRTHSYPVYDHVRQVPWLVWWDPRLVVEKFLPEKRDGFFCVRTWVFFGQREAMSLNLGPRPIVKRENVVHSETLADVPGAIRAARERLGFDYGKFDFVIHDGEPVLLDTNPTPTTGVPPSPRASAAADELAPGLHEFVPNGCGAPLR